MNTQKNLDIVRDFFTDEQWLAIEYALGDYQDYGDEQAEISSQIEAKIYKLFNPNSLKITDLK
tara:strand:+ start:361 stop:549 length:189 start_codon:yes stop_codon:yes gene_type:complete